MKRIKRALAAFLRDELLDYIGYKHSNPLSRMSQELRVNQIDFDVLKMEEMIDFELIDNSVYPASVALEDTIRMIKKRFAEQVVDHIHVDARKLIDNSHFADLRSITLTLRVQKKQ